MSYSNDQFVSITTTATSAMEKHVKFWDRKNKGYITPVDTVFGFINLGYGLVISITLGTFIGILCSYTTQDSWIPDILCRTRTEKLQQGARKEPYNSIGQLDLELFEQLFEKHARSDISGKTITVKELLEWNEATYKEPLNWSATALEWLAIYLLVGSKGIVKKEDIQAAYDGTLFYQVHDRNKQNHRTMIIQDASSADNNNNLLTVSGVKVSKKSYIHQLESQMNHILPRNTVSLLETRLRHWLSFVQQQQQQPTLTSLPILKGVPTPVPTRSSLFDGVRGGGGGLTGVIGNNLLDSNVSLTGVQDHDAAEMDDDGVELCGLIKDDDGNETTDDYYYGNDDAAVGMAGVRSENEDDDNWLHTEQLTGVSPSTSATTHLAKTAVQEQQVVYENEEEDEHDGDKQPLDVTNGSTPPLTETSSVTSDIDGSDDTASHKDHEEELYNNKTSMNIPSSNKKKNKKKNKKNKQQQQQAPTPPAKNDDDHDDDLVVSHDQHIKHTTTTTTTTNSFHHHSAWPPMTESVSTDG